MAFVKQIMTQTWFRLMGERKKKKSYRVAMYWEMYDLQKCHVQDFLD